MVATKVGGIVADQNVSTFGTPPHLHEIVSAKQTDFVRDQHLNTSGAKSLH
jgi:hypothetical protein